MLKRRKIRELAMQILFLWDHHGDPDPLLAAQVAADDRAIDDETRRAGLKMAGDAWNACAPITRPM